MFSTISWNEAPGRIQCGGGSGPGIECTNLAGTPAKRWNWAGSLDGGTLLIGGCDRQKALEIASGNAASAPIRGLQGSPGAVGRGPVWGNSISESHHRR